MRTTRLSRLPLRVRLVAGFAVVMAVVLTGAGAFLYWRVDYALDRRLDTDLVQEADAVRALMGPDGRVAVSSAADAVPGVAEHQVLDRSGRVLSAGAGLGTAPVLGSRALRAALRGPVFSDVGSLFSRDRPLRLYAAPLSGHGDAAVLVVAVRRDARDEALRELLLQLGVAGAATLLLTTVVGERLAKAALAPVERYRAQARDIAAGAGGDVAGLRLDVPAGRDDEVTRLGHTLNAMLAALEASLERERRFLQDASHELRTPLTLLRTRIQVTRRRPRTPAEHEAALAELEADVADLHDLAEQLLQLTAAGGATDGAADPAAEPGDVTRVVTDLSSSAGGEGGGEGGWELAVAPGAEATPVAARDGELRQVLLNLLGNAAAHGAPPVRVGVRADADRTGAPVAVLTVTDGGDGVPAAFLPAAVERFARTDTARDRPGAGLGLALVHAVVARRGGELRLCSNGAHHRFEDRWAVPCEHPDRGTTATVLLPLLRPAAGR